MASLDVDVFTKPFQLTKSMHRQLYPSLEPSNPNLKASGKVVLITGAGGTLGGVSMARSNLHLLLALPLPELINEQTLDRTLRSHGAQRVRPESFSSAAGSMVLKRLRRG